MTHPNACAVLFVDDEPLVLQGLKRMLRGEREAWAMQFAASGREALSLLEREAFDAVVTDLRMPGMDGEQLLNTVKDRHPHMVRIVLSGEMNQASGFKTVRCAHRYLAKPCDAEALKSALSQAFALRRWVDDRRLKELLARLDSLPSLPEIYAELLAEIQAPNSSFRRVGDLIARDVGMTAKVLQIVNSAFFGLTRRILNPQDAVAMLGYDTLKALVLSNKIFSQFDAKRVRCMDVNALWQHSMNTGLFARTIAVGEKLPRTAQDEAFTAGVLHDVGKLILAHNFPELYADVVMRSRAHRRPAAELEQEIFGGSHAELGAYLLGLWGIGEEVVDAIAYHQCPSRASTLTRVLAVVYAANGLEHMLSGTPGDEAAAAVDPEVLKQLNVAERFGAWEGTCRGICSRETERV
ncbi:MAG: HDOD domain-containing protein [Deltaproteobacteria bacterium]|nr:HDOD domain-containing protein [Deltaproteobacteria bacterium]